MDYGMTITLDLPYEQAVPAVKAALMEQGSGFSPRSTPRPR
jgi:hypothetical protein